MENNNIDKIIEELSDEFDLSEVGEKLLRKKLSQFEKEIREDERKKIFDSQSELPARDSFEKYVRNKTLDEVEKGLDISIGQVKSLLNNLRK